MAAHKSSIGFKSGDLGGALITSYHLIPGQRCKPAFHNGDEGVRAKAPWIEKMQKTLNQTPTLNSE